MIRTKRNANLRMIKDINITPFTDVVLVLLIIFMVTAPVMMKQETNLRMDLPKAATRDEPMASSITIYLTADEQIQVNNAAVAPENLRPTLQGLQQKMGTNMVIIKGDQGIEYRRVIEAIDIARQVGLTKIALATQVAEGGLPEQP